MKTILAVLAEGGSVTLTGVRRKQGWRYRLSVNDSTPVFLDDEPPLEYSLNEISSWRMALRLLDRYHWHELYPLAVHPEFRQKIRAAYRRRAAKGGVFEFNSAERWREFL
jgi:hypothetical protein